MGAKRKSRARNQRGVNAIRCRKRIMEKEVDVKIIIMGKGARRAKRKHNTESAEDHREHGEDRPRKGPTLKVESGVGEE